MKPKQRRIKFKNGLTATLHVFGDDLKNDVVKSQQLVALGYSLLPEDLNGRCYLKFCFGQNKIKLLFPFNTQDIVTRPANNSAPFLDAMSQVGINVALKNALLILVNNQLFSPFSKRGKTILRALHNGLDPCIYVLLTYQGLARMPTGFSRGMNDKKLKYASEQ